MKDNKKPFLLTVAGGKGGVGKSFIAANIACALASKGVTTLIWDADIRFPNQHLMFGVEPPVRLNDVYAGRIELDRAVYYLKDDLYIIADLPAAGKSEEFDPTAIDEIYSKILNSNRFDVVIADTGNGASAETLQCCYLADEIALVATDEPTSLLDAYGLVKILLKYADPDKIKLIVNNVIDDEDAEDVSQKLNLAADKFLGFTIEAVGFLPYDRGVRQSILRQEPLFGTSTDSEIAKSLVKLGDYYSEKIPIKQTREI